MTEHALERMRHKVGEMIDTCKEAGSRDVIIDQQLELKQKGYSNTAHQGNIIINIVNQEILIGLFELKEALGGLIDNGQIISGDNFNIESIKTVALDRAMERAGGVQRKAAKLLGISDRTIANWLNK